VTLCWFQTLFHRNSKNQKFWKLFYDAVFSFLGCIEFSRNFKNEFQTKIFGEIFDRIQHKIPPYYWCNSKACSYFGTFEILAVLIIYVQWLTKDWRLFQVLSTIEMRQSLVNHLTWIFSKFVLFDFLGINSEISFLYFEVQP